MIKTVKYAIFTTIALSCFLFSVTSFADGALGHIYIAGQAEQLLKPAQPVSQSQPALYQVISQYNNEYLVGSDYPDFGYMPGMTFGAVTHTQAFVDAFIAYINAKAPGSAEHRQQLIAFFMGIGAHLQTDKDAHDKFYLQVATNDFHDRPNPQAAWAAADRNMDLGSDFYVILKKHICNHPVIWWVPVQDLVAVYQNIGANVTAGQIKTASAMYYVATGLSEVAISVPGYKAALAIVPWGMANLENTNPKVGAFPTQTTDSAVYMTCLWNQLLGTSSTALPTIQIKQNTDAQIPMAPIVAFVQKAVANHWIEIKPTVNSDGSITITPESIVKTSTYVQKENEFIQSLRSQYLTK